ncbi:hypothetical protein AVEN_191048-1 [Araneus ventricosus]|uniref:Uncharacterized protein n=1 Tax=Araneus ventricosus TaxID=182803 RepID=A0A4Y2AZR6_ARAVE|nr:hypothetical protein AVEN_191048-1 [Araneus ventricosus]
MESRNIKERFSANGIDPFLFPFAIPKTSYSSCVNSERLANRSEAPFVNEDVSSCRPPVASSFKTVQPLKYQQLKKTLQNPTEKRNIIIHLVH